MNKEWSKLNKSMQAQIKKKDTWLDGVDTLISLRNQLMDTLLSFKDELTREDFDAMPYINADGYHSKNIAYSIWHIFRIEDIVAHTLISNDEQILFRNDNLKKTGSPIITTGNELKGEKIAEFSKQLNVKALLDYCRSVKDSTDELLRNLEYKNLKRKFTDQDRQRLIESDWVSKDEDALWLVDYWCGKDIRGLIQMPFSRHWIMHVEAMCRIKNKLCLNARKGVDPIACCGLSCEHCFLKEWCGGCRTSYNTCSYATVCPDHICPNVRCCKEKGLDGCYECDDLINCKKGFYANGNDANAVKTMALFISRYGKKELAEVLDKLHQKYDFKKIQEILGYDLDEGLKMLEKNR